MDDDVFQSRRDDLVVGERRGIGSEWLTGTYNMDSPLLKIELVSQTNVYATPKLSCAKRVVVHYTVDEGQRLRWRTSAYGRYRNI